MAKCCKKSKGKGKKCKWLWQELKEQDQCLQKQELKLGKDTAAEGNLKSKFLYKLFLITLKYIPVFIVLSYILNTILCWFGIDAPILSNLAGVSLFTWIFLYIATYVFKFCKYHRLLLYFILLEDSINIYDYYFSIPIETHKLLELHTTLIGLLIILLVLKYVANNKKIIIKNNR